MRLTRQDSKYSHISLVFILLLFRTLKMLHRGLPTGFCLIQEITNSRKSFLYVRLLPDIFSHLGHYEITGE